MLNLQFADPTIKRPLAAVLRKRTGREIVLEALDVQLKLLRDPNAKIERDRYKKADDGTAITEGRCSASALVVEGWRRAVLPRNPVWVCWGAGVPGFRHRPDEDRYRRGKNAGRC